MSDGQQFFLVLTLFYLSDCIRWAPLHAAAFQSFFLRGWTLRRPSELFGTARWGLVMSFPLPPLGNLFLAQPWPVALTREGVSSPTLDHPNPGFRIPRPESFLAWDEIQSVSAERRALLVNGALLARLSSPSQALHLAGLIESLRNEPGESRAAAISAAVRSSLRPLAVRRRAAHFLRATRSLRWSENLLFALLYGIIPLAYARWGATAPFFLILAGGWLLMWQIALDFRQRHRRWYPGEKPARWQHLLAQVLFPPTTLRAHDELSAGYLSQFHPLAIAQALLSQAEFQQKADAVRRDASFPLPLLEAVPDPVRRNAAAFHQDHLLPALREFFERYPAPSPRPAGSHCPRCLVEYASETESCRDCGGIKLAR